MCKRVGRIWYICSFWVIGSFLHLEWANIDTAWMQIFQLCFQAYHLNCCIIHLIPECDKKKRFYCHIIYLSIISISFRISRQKSVCHHNKMGIAEWNANYELFLGSYNLLSDKTIVCCWLIIQFAFRLISRCSRWKSLVFDEGTVILSG